MLTRRFHHRLRKSEETLLKKSDEINVVQKDLFNWIARAEASSEIRCEFHTHYHIQPRESRVSLELSNDISALEKEFNERADRWEREVRVYSSPTKRFLHEDYQIIMTMGEPVIPLILKRLRDRPNDWFWALKHLAKKDVAAGCDNFPDAVRAWLDWGKEKYPN